MIFPSMNAFDFHNCHYSPFIMMPFYSLFALLLVIAPCLAQDQLELASPKPTHSFTTEQAKLARAGAAATAANDLDAAQAIYRKLVESAPDNPLSHANLATVDYRLGNFAASVESLNKAVSMDPTLTDSWLTLSMAYHQLDEPDLALSAVARAMANSDRQALAHQYMALIVSSRGWGDAAESELREAIKLDPNNADTHFNLAILYLQKTPPAATLARQHYKKARDLGAPKDDAVELFFAEYDNAEARKK